MFAVSQVSPSHEGLLRNLESSLPSFLDLQVFRSEQRCPTGVYKHAGWQEATQEKLRAILRRMDQLPEGELLLYTDVDVQFLNHDGLEELLRAPFEDPRLWLAAQSGTGAEDYVCAGFFVARVCRETKTLLRQADQRVSESDTEDDEDAVNALLREYRKFVGPHIHQSYDLARVWCPRKFWRPGMPLRVPAAIQVHHANWCKGLEHKLEQLKSVRRMSRCPHQCHGQRFCPACWPDIPPGFSR